MTTSPHETREFLLELLDDVNDLVQSVAPDGRVLYVNRAWRETLGYTEEEARRLSLRELIHPESLAHCMETFARVQRGERVKGVAATLLAKDGRKVFVEVSSSFSFRDGEPAATRTAMKDVTRRREVEESLVRAKETYRELVESISDIIYTTDGRGLFTYVSPVIETLGGYTPAEVVGRSFSEFVYPEDLPVAVESFRRTLAGQSEPVEFRVLSRGGEPRWIRKSSQPVFEGGSFTGTRGLIHDITERKLAEERLRELSLTDELTGLRNRRGFITLAEQQLKLARERPDGSRLLLVYADMDGLKQINDRFGHEEGSRAIRAAAELFRRGFRDSDLVARLGGDEFTALAVYAAPDTGRLVVPRLQAGFDDYNTRSGLPYALSVSLGVTTVGGDGCDGTIDELLAAADRRMYEQKRRKLTEPPALD